MSYRDDAVDLIAGEIEREEKAAGKVSPAKPKKEEKPLEVDPAEVEEVAGGVEVSAPEIDETKVEEEEN